MRLSCAARAESVSTVLTCVVRIRDACSKLCNRTYNPLFIDDLSEEGHWAKGHKQICSAGANQRAAEATAEREEAPKEFLCPITQDVMDDPVEATDKIRVIANLLPVVKLKLDRGFNVRLFVQYERRSITLWMAEKTREIDDARFGLRHCDGVARRMYERKIAIGIKSPATGVPLVDTTLKPDCELRSRISMFRKERRNAKGNIQSAIQRVI